MKDKNKAQNPKPIHGVLFYPVLPIDNSRQTTEQYIQKLLDEKNSQKPKHIEPVIFDYSLRPSENNDNTKRDLGKHIETTIPFSLNSLTNNSTQDYVQPSPYEQTVLDEIDLSTQSKSKTANNPQLEQEPQSAQTEIKYNKNTMPKPTKDGHMQPLKDIHKQSLTKPAKINPEALKDKILKKFAIFVHEDYVYIYNGICYEQITDKQLQKKVYYICKTDIKNIGSINFLNEVCKFIKIEPGIQYSGSLHNSHILTFLNGNLNLIDGQLYEHSPQVITCYALQCNYLSNQQKLNTPYFDTLLENISGGNAGIKQRIWQMFGYCLAPDTKAKNVFLLQGARHSGKSLLCRLLESFFPKSAISALNAHDFSSKFALSELENKALCVSADMSADPLNARTISNIKQLSGDDLISAAKKYSNNREFNFFGKLVLVSNHKLLTKNCDDAFEDRFIAIPFPYSIPTEEQDRDLFDKLLQEKDAIATKAIQYYFRLRQNHYIFAGDYELNSGDFLNNECENNNETKIDCFIKKCFEADRNSELFISDIYALFLELFDSDIKLNSFSQIFFNKAKALFNCNKSRKRKNTNSNPTSLITGIALKEEYIKLLGE